MLIVAPVCESDYSVHDCTIEHLLLMRCITKYSLLVDSSRQLCLQLCVCVIYEMRCFQSEVYGRQMAATNGHCSVVQMLIEHSADVNTADDEGRTPLHSAADNADVNVVRALLCAKADVSVTDKMGDTPLDFAEEAENEDAAEEVQKMLQDASEE